MFEAILFDKDGTLYDFQGTYGSWACDLVRDLAKGDALLAACLAAELHLDLERREFEPASIAIAGTADDIADVVARCAARGVELKWFGAERAQGFTSTYRHWAYATSAELPQTDRVLSGLIDMRLPLTFSTDDCKVIAGIIREDL